MTHSITTPTLSHPQAGARLPRQPLQPGTTHSGAHTARLGGLTRALSAPPKARGVAPPKSIGRFRALILLAALALGVSGCQVLTYRGPNGERFTRSSFGANTSIASLIVEGDTNGVRRVELQGYQNDTTQALGAVTEAAVRAALQGAR